MTRLSGIALAAANILGFCFFAVSVYGSLLNLNTARSIQAGGIVFVNLVFLILYIFRQEPKTISGNSWAWILGFSGTVFPMLLRPHNGEETWITSMGFALQMAGIVLILVSLASLRLSFGIVPANRGIRQDGFYRFVRHPLYGSELLSLSGFVIANPTIANGAILAVEILLQYARARLEERHLRDDEIYSAYLARTPYRFVPGIL